MSISREHVCGPGAKESLEAGMNNVAFLRTSIELISYFFAPGEVAEIWITFPDPQMKKVNKRLTGTRFMKSIGKSFPEMVLSI